MDCAWITCLVLVQMIIIFEGETGLILYIDGGKVKTTHFLDIFECQSTVSCVIVISCRYCINSFIHVNDWVAAQTVTPR